MQESKLRTLWEADLPIASVKKIYHSTCAHWARVGREPRVCDGLLLFTSGGIRYEFDGFSFEAHAGDVLKLPRGIPYGGQDLAEGEHSFYVIDFDTGGIDDFLHFPLPLSFTPPHARETEERFALLAENWRNKAFGYRLNAKEGLAHLLSFLVAEYASTVGKVDTDVMRVCAFLNDHIADTSLRIEDAASFAHWSVPHLNRRFRAAVGTSPWAYLIAGRMERAKYLLTARFDDDLNTIARLCGFTSSYYLSAAFKKHEGVTCSAYRRAHRPE